MNTPRYLFNCLLDGKGAANALVDIIEPHQVVPPQCHWLHLDVNENSARDWLISKSGLSETVADSLMAGETRPRSLAEPDGLLVVLRGVNLNPGEDPEDMVSIRIWIEKTRIISSRRRQLLSITDIREALEKGKGPRSSGDFLVMIIEKLADRIGAFVESIEDRLEQAEDDLQQSGYASIRQRLVALRRQIASVRRFLAPQRDALDRLYRNPGKVLSAMEANSLREESDRITRYLEDLDLARERAVVMQEEILSQMAQEQNTRMYVLSVVAAIFLPLTFVTGLLGMNVGGLPGLEDPAGFWVAMGMMLAATVFLVVFFRWKRWI